MSASFKGWILATGVPVFLPWIEPTRNESLESYAFRMSAGIKEQHPLLLGISFGGMLAVEISKVIDCEKIILISTAVVEGEIPWLYRFAGRLGLHRLIPGDLLKHGNRLTYWLFGMKSKAGKVLLGQILKDTDPRFLKWAIHVIVHWRNKDAPSKMIRLHGDSDRILPHRMMNRIDFLIPGGGHLMVFEQAGQVNDLLVTPHET